MDQPQATMEDKVLDIVKSEPLSTEEHDHSEPMDIDTIEHNSHSTRKQLISSYEYREQE